MTVDFKKLVTHKTFDVLMAEAEARFKELITKNSLPITNFSDMAVTKNMFSVFCFYVSEMYDMVVDEFLPSRYIDTAWGTFLDQEAIEVGLARKLATFATYNVTFTRTGASTGNISIPIETVVKTSSDANGDFFRFLVATADVLEDDTTATGTLSTSGTTVTGVGTLAGTEFAVGDVIRIGAEDKIVQTITNAVSWTIDSAFTGDPLSGVTFKYKHESMKILVSAEAAGVKYNVSALDINTLVTSISGIASVSNVLANDQVVVAVNEETDEELRTRIKNRWLSISRGGTIPVYTALARTVAGIFDVQVDATNPRGEDTVDVYYTKTSGIPVAKTGTGTVSVSGDVVTGVGTAFLDEIKVGDRLIVDDDDDSLETSTIVSLVNSNTDIKLKHNPRIKLTGTVAVTQNSTAVVGTGTLFTAELTNGESVQIRDEVFTVTVTDATNLVLNSVMKLDDATDLSMTRVSPVNITSNAFTYEQTNEVQALYNADTEHILASDVETFFPVAIPTAFTVVLGLHPTKGNVQDIEAKAKAIIDAFFVADDAWPTVLPVQIGKDLKVSSITGALWKLDAEGVVDVTVSAPAANVAVAKNKMITKGTVSVTVNRETL